MGAPAAYDFSVWRGNTFSRIFRMKDADDELVDLTGSTVVFTARSTPYEFELIKTLTVADPPDGEAMLSFTAAETKSFPLDVPIEYEIERFIDDEQVTLVEGTITGNGGVNDD